MDGDERKQEDLFREMVLGPNARMGRPGLAASPGPFRRLLWAIRDSAEAVRILETHRRAGRLTPEGLKTLERYRRFHEAAVLVLVGHCPRPDGPAPASGAERLGGAGMDRAVVLVGTETGGAEDLAGELAVTLAGAGVDTEVVDMEDADCGLLDGSRAVIVCTATHGDGELPNNSKDFFEALGEEWPDLEGVMFAVCGLGNSIHPDLHEAGRIWSSFLADLGATEVVQRYEIDGFLDQADVEGAREWVLEAAGRFDELAEERGLRGR